MGYQLSGTIVILLILVAGSWFWWTKQPHREPPRAEPSTVASSPTPHLSPAAPTSSRAVTPSTVAPLPPAVNLAVPFTVQAPHANWSPPYGEFCEEASVLMAMSYVNHQKIPTADFADQALLAIQDFEEKKLGFYEDTTAAETARIIREYYHYDHVQVVSNPTVTNIKQAVATGKLVLVPAAGQELGNPYFKQPGPLYHMVVIKGYNAQGQFIVNDPGTRHGADYVYDEAVIMNAMHEWRPDRNITAGAKVVLIIGR